MAPVPLVEELVPAPDPMDVAARFSGLPHLVFLDSSAPLSALSRYSFLTADPVQIILSHGATTTRYHPARGETTILESDPIQAVLDYIHPFAHQPLPGIPPFQGGAAGFIGYEYGRRLERLPRPRFDDTEMPEVSVGIYDWTIAWDHQLKRAWIISTGLPSLDRSRATRAAERLRWVQAGLSGQATGWQVRRADVRTRLAPSFPVMEGNNVRSSFTPAGYQAAVARVIEYILQGDVFQVNLAQRFEMPSPEDALALYRRLRAITPAPFGAFLDLGSGIIASASPERFLYYDEATRQVETRPIKGTRPRGTSPAEDQALQMELQSSEKDRAENIMIVDLLRNDLSRVCEPGSVQVPSLLALESHPTVHHLVSTVTGTLERDRTAADLLHASFPGGSITGAPKIRAMEIIAELEPTARGPYTGALGYWSLSGTIDTSIVIRTYVMAGDRVYFHAGGGIVADSNPLAEYRETLDKAAALIRALAP